MLLSEKQKELAIIVAKDLVAKLLEDPGKHLVSGKEGAVKAFGDVLQGVVIAINDIFITTPAKKS